MQEMIEQKIKDHGKLSEKDCKEIMCDFRTVAWDDFKKFALSLNDSTDANIKWSIAALTKWEGFMVATSTPALIYTVVWLIVC